MVLHLVENDIIIKLDKWSGRCILETATVPGIVYQVDVGPLDGCYVTWRELL